ncbi:lipoprotein [Chitinibacter bivalviorum]|uniref:Lipoprotein n=1 Tax=Chitinibacter bivalviorum TaxID=2739434 RepID=A0A7H9BIB8_9NEIS|nr:lipoprotein [Chitinibacter bivalviorum]QLG88377.1 lipoprotein [Chitinibacter bivalviorum]
MRALIVFIFVAISATGLLSACGFKGPLYLPKPKVSPPAASSAVASATTSAAIASSTRKASQSSAASAISSQ